MNTVTSSLYNWNTVTSSPNNWNNSSSSASFTYMDPSRSLTHLLEDMPPSTNINDVKIYNDRVIKVFFSDGMTEKAICQMGDKFDLDVGITICIMKHIFGKNKYFKMLKKAKKNAEKNRELERKAKEAMEIKQRQKAKKEKKKQARRERKNKELATIIAETIATHNKE